MLAANISIATPAIPKNGVNDEGLNSSIKKEPPDRAFSDKIHAVAVVPKFAPIISPTAFFRAIIPEFTSPTVRTVTAEDDCTIAVIRVPKTKPEYLFLVMRPIACSSLPPAILDSAPLIVSIPNRKRASPLNNPVTMENICL